MKYAADDPSHFLNRLPLTDADRRKLGALAPKNAFDLLARRKSATADFDAYVGADRAEFIARSLASLLSESERVILAEPEATRRRLGARIDRRS